MSTFAALPVLSPQAAAEVHPARSTVSERVNAASFVVLTCWPYALVPNEATIAMLGIVSLIALLNRPQVLPRLSPLLLVFIAYFAFVFGLRSLQGGMTWFAISQSNHLVQFAVYYVAFSKIVQGCDWEGIVASKLFLIGSAILTFTYYSLIGGLGSGGNQGDLSITLLALILGLFLRGHSGRPLTYFVLIAIVGTVLLFATARLSMALLLAMVFVAYWVRLPRYVVPIVVAGALLVPLCFYLLIDTHELSRLYAIDHNSGIRAEFIRGASALLERSPWLGTGFGGPYRPINFPYLVPHHPLLSDLAAVHVTSNHHSLFDVAFRLGVPAAAVFALGVFWHPRATTNSHILPLLAIVVAVGLSFNAWLENQDMLPQLVMVVALMHAGSGTGGRVADRS